MGEMRNVYKISVCKPEEELSVDVKIILKCILRKQDGIL
jgi:hypothetical protein